MLKTQSHLPIEDIKDNLVILKDGSVAIIIQTSAVNFGLLSEQEQMAIIGSFAQMLNSLSFAIQIVIRSKRLDISTYLKLLDKQLRLQTNPLLAQMMLYYSQFVQSLIKDNEVLDKSFYIAIDLSRLEMGVGLRTQEDVLKKAKTVLGPRRDQIIRMLSRIGLKGTQLFTQQLIALFYDIYNSELESISDPEQAQDANTQTADQPSNQPTPVLPTNPPAPAPTPVLVTPLPPPYQSYNQPKPINPPMPQNVPPAATVQSFRLPLNPPSPSQPMQQRPTNHPFVVEELVETP